jgi:CBS domain-containing protein
MKVKELMSRGVLTCRAHDDLNRAAQIMWEGNCGIVPVVDDEGRPIGMITDRDVCMSAYLKGATLRSMRVRDAMAKHVTSCALDAAVETAMELMGETRVRRLPVVDSKGVLVGLLSLNDLAREARRHRKSSGGSRFTDAVVDTLGAVCDAQRTADTATQSVKRGSSQLAGAGA